MLIKPIYVLGIDAQVQNSVGDEKYGAYFAIFNFCFLFQILLDLGIQNFNSKEVSQNREKVSDVFSYVIGTKLMLIVLFLSGISLAAWIIGYPITYFPYILGVGTIMIFQSLYIYLRSHFSALGHFKTETYLSALDKLLMILVLAYFIYYCHSIDIEKFILGQITALVTACLITALLLKSLISIRIKFSIAKAKALLHKSWPFALVFLLMTLYTRMDGVMLERLLDDTGKAAGIYATGYRLLDAANIIGYLFAILLLPMFARLLGENENVNPLIKAAAGVLIPGVTAISIISWFYAPDIINAIYTSTTELNVRTFKILMLSFWFVSLSYIYGTLITASGELRIFNMIFIIGIIVNWGLNLHLIPRSGPIGAAQATLFTQGLVFVGQYLLARGKFKIETSIDFVFKVLVFVAITFAICQLMTNYAAFWWPIEVILIGLFLLLVSFLLGLFRLSWTNLK